MRVLLFFKISMMAFALTGVFYIMRYMRSQEFVQQTKSPDSPMAVLLGTASLRPFNWCPPGVQKVEVISSKKIVTDPKQMIGLCQAMMEPVLKDDAEVNDYLPMVVATGSQATKTLEKNSKNIFRVDGLPFRSQFFEKLLQAP